MYNGHNAAWKVDEWAHLLNSRDCQYVRELNLKHCAIDDQNINMLGATRLAGLVNLVLDENQLNAQSLAKFLTVDLKNLRTLDLNSNTIGDQGLSLLLFHPLSKILTQLSIGRTGLSRTGLKLAKNWSSTQLLTLALNNNAIGSSGIKYLNKAELVNLQRIQLYSCVIGCQGLKHLVKANWPKLKHLNTNCNKVESDGHCILYLGNWDKLVFLANWQYHSIHYIGLVTANWSKKITLDNNTQNPALRRDIKRIFKNKFM